MFVRIKKSWELPESDVTPESIYVQRRTLLKAAGFSLAAGLIPTTSMGTSAGFPSNLNPKYPAGDLNVTKEDLITSYNNFYEFSFDKQDVAEQAENFKSEPWTLEISGMVHKPQKFDVNKLVNQLGNEQRVYRFRCVEAWAMVAPWDGFPLQKLVELVQPTSQAKYLRFVSFLDHEMAPGQVRAPQYPWPYNEGLTLAEATNELPLMVTGVYGKPLPSQNGAPLRLIVPWKYGFKSIKSITKIEFTDKMPKTLWSDLAPSEYGFYANVNPEVDHPRWSQKQERIVGTWFKKQETLKFNGYGDQVAGLYKGMDLKKWY
ncbi:MAG: protein-methionine-sulfoxide reductase catalytic subunit MsrP [SAR324 cluster bacterium]|nr:protein-methionine-sulfoxide reductase catalytic subunit MsrP [SAR324 cluster bacterium]